MLPQDRDPARAIKIKMDVPAANTKPSTTEMTRNETTETETITEDEPSKMCSFQMLAIPIRVGAKTPANVDKAGAPIGLYVRPPLRFCPCVLPE